MNEKEEVIYIAIDCGLSHDRFKIYNSIEEAKEDKSFLFDRLYEARRVI